MTRQRRELLAARFLGCALATAIAYLGTVAPVGAAVVSDNFNADVNYAFGAVGGIWSGSENMSNLNGGLFNANLSNPGVLTIEDTGTFDADGDAGNGISGAGWEGGRSTSPFLYANVPAGQDFTATVKVSAQTSGQWSAAGIIARAANSPTPPGIGANHTDENFATMTTFRTDAANANEGNTLMKRIQGGAQMSDINIGVNLAATEPLPLVIRLERIGGIGYRGWVSQDNGATFQLQSHFVPTAGNALRDLTVPMQVGLSYMTFGGLAGNAQFDDFTLDTHDPLPAPVAPNLTSTNTSFTGAPGAMFSELISDTTGQSLLSFTQARTGPTRPAAPITTALPTLTPGAQGPLQPNGGGASTFAWNTTNWLPGLYTLTITATNDWGATGTRVLTVRLIPEPSAIALAGLAIASLMASIHRRR